MLNFEEEGGLKTIPGLGIQPMSGFVPAAVGSEAGEQPRVIGSIVKK